MHNYINALYSLVCLFYWRFFKKSHVLILGCFLSPLRSEQNVEHFLRPEKRAVNTIVRLNPCTEMGLPLIRVDTIISGTSR